MNFSNLMIEGMWLANERAARNQKLKSQVADLINTINGKLDEFDTAVKHINGDADLSGNGRRNAIGRLSVDYRGAIEGLVDPMLQDLDSRIAEYTAVVTPQPPSNDDTVEELRQQEGRRLLRHKDQLEIQAMYMSWAADGGNDLMMRAVENAPLPMLPAEIVAKGKQMRAERESPQATADLRELKEARADLESLKLTALSHCRVESDDVVVRAARTGSMAAAG